MLLLRGDHGHPSKKRYAFLSVFHAEHRWPRSIHPNQKNKNYVVNDQSQKRMLIDRELDVSDHVLRLPVRWGCPRSIADLRNTAGEWSATPWPKIRVRFDMGTMLLYGPREGRKHGARCQHWSAHRGPAGGTRTRRQKMYVVF